MKELPISCFLPGTWVQFAWDSTSLGWLKDCPRKYYYYMILGIRTKGSNVHLSFGLWYQSAIETYEKIKAAGEDHESAIRAAILRALRDSKGFAPENETKKTRENLIRTLVWKLDRYKDDPVKTIIFPDGTPAVELSFRFEIDHEVEPGKNYMLSGHFDRLATFNGDPFVEDNKTTGQSLSSYYFRQYSPNNQMSLYTVGGQIVYHTPVRGVIITAAQIAVGFSEFQRTFAYRTKGQNEEWLKSTIKWLDQAKIYACDPDGGEAAWPMNDKNCSNYGGCPCPFIELCDKDPSVRDNFIRTDFEPKHWNPLETRE